MNELFCRNAKKKNVTMNVDELPKLYEERSKIKPEKSSEPEDLALK